MPDHVHGSNEANPDALHGFRFSDGEERTFYPGDVLLVILKTGERVVLEKAPNDGGADSEGPFAALHGFPGRPPGWLGGFGTGGGIGNGRGFGGPRERLFDPGEIRLVVLKLLSEHPGYGYQLIKTMEQRLAGGYTPSAGVIYPTLTMLEEEGLATASSESGKKVYSVTPEGMEYLQTNKERIERIFARLEEAGKGFERGRSGEIMKAFMNLKSAVAARMSRGNTTPEQIRKMAEAIHAAAKSIDEL